MLLLDFRTPTVPMPVPGFLNQGLSTVSEELEAVGVGLAFPPHEYAVASRFIYAVGPADGEKKELYAVRVEGTPGEPTNTAFVTAAARLLSFDRKKEPYPQIDNLDFDRSAGPPRPAVVNALTKALTKNNGSGKRLSTMICV